MFKRCPDERRRIRHCRFNLLSEILFVQARKRSPSWTIRCRFQSLERDSVCSSQERRRERHGQPTGFQSLERDSVCSSHQIAIERNVECQFQSLELDSVCSSSEMPTKSWPWYPFQSLERDSVCSSSTLTNAEGRISPVSIS